MDTAFWYYILILIIVIFLAVAIWLIFFSGRDTSSENRRRSHRSHIFNRKPRYGMVWKTDFSGPLEESGKFDYVRWAVPLTEAESCGEVGYYQDNVDNLSMIPSCRGLNYGTISKALIGISQVCGQENSSSV